MLLNWGIAKGLKAAVFDAAICHWFESNFPSHESVSIKLDYIAALLAVSMDFALKLPLHSMWLVANGV